MAEIIKLRTARKARDREDAAARADANRAKFGRSKVEKQADATETARREQMLDGAQLSNTDPG
jgi:hypothetical protein